MYYREVKQIKGNEKMSFDGTVEECSISVKQVTANSAALFYLFKHILHLILMLCINSYIICLLRTGLFKTH